MTPIVRSQMIRMAGDDAEQMVDEVVREVRLTIVLNGKKHVSLMCLPTHMDELVVGYLMTEGFTLSQEVIACFRHEEKGESVQVFVECAMDVSGGMTEATVTTGCGGASIFADLDMPSGCKKIDTTTQLEAEKVFSLMKEFQQRSELFLATGGVHSAALADEGRILIFMDDVGRHNAIDKVIGRAFIEGINLKDKIILTSGRLSSDILFKTIRQKIPMVISRSAPTSYALRLAERYFVTVVGFVRGRRMNIYSYPRRILGYAAPR